MRAALLRGLELAAILAILGFAGLQIWLGLGDPVRDAIAVAGACVGLIGVAVGELAASEPRAAAEPPPPEALLKDAMDRVLSGVRSYLEESLIYGSDLEGIDAGLAAVTDPARAREAITALRLANRRMN